MTGGRAGRGGREGWSFGGFLSSLPRTTCIFSFMGYGFAVLDEWVTLQSDIRPRTDFWKLLGCRGKFVWGIPTVRKPKICAELFQPTGIKSTCFLWCDSILALRLEMLWNCRDRRAFGCVGHMFTGFKCTEQRSVSVCLVTTPNHARLRMFECLLATLLYISLCLYL